ncbi:MAG: hypothetical protein A3J38_02965 [Gammaproteobacteria bacterium RIFCSPHIGHO2_12_FULL_45_9]|nr:MAG: hypothetical protein A3J38_02965 [Gammaproteobacteria bacterium RIFCSPHIGHO2_12_FULL_45_9]
MTTDFRSFLKRKLKVRTLNNKLLVGWQEWCALSQHGLPALKAKIDTGAKTSALHAHHIEPFKRLHQDYVRFIVHPLQNTTDHPKICTAEVIDQRYVMSSNGHREWRYVIQTPLTLGADTWNIELTLSNRDPLTFRLLLGREALNGRVLINPKAKLCQGRLLQSALQTLYPTH